MKQQTQPSSSPIRSSPRRKIIFLSLFYFLITVSLSSFVTVIIYIHQKYKHRGYGESYLTANNVASIFMYFVAPYFVERGRRKSRLLLLGCAGAYFVNMAVPAVMAIVEAGHGHGDGGRPSGFRFGVELAANVVGGLGSGLFWVLQGIYMTNYCKNVATHEKGKYFSLANVILSSRIVIAPLLTMIGLGFGNEATYFGLLSLIIVLALPIGVYWVPEIDLCEGEGKEREGEGLVGRGDGDVDKIQEDKSGNEAEQRKSQGLFSHILSFLKYFKQVSLLLPNSILTGLLAGFISSSLSHLLPIPVGSQNNDSNIAIALIFYGVGNVVGGHLSGWMCDRRGVRVAGYVGAGWVILGAMVEAIALSMQHTVVLSCVVAVIFGVAFSYMYTLISLLCTINYKGSPYSFATNRQVTNFSYMGYQWLVAFLNNTCNMNINMTYQGLALIPLAIFGAFCLRLEGGRKGEWVEDGGTEMEMRGTKKEQVQNQEEEAEKEEQK